MLSCLHQQGCSSTLASRWRGRSEGGLNPEQCILSLYLSACWISVVSASSSSISLITLESSVQITSSCSFRISFSSGRPDTVAGSAFNAASTFASLHKECLMTHSYSLRSFLPGQLFQVGGQHVLVVTCKIQLVMKSRRDHRSGLKDHVITSPFI